jgi:hypothetical protein
MPERMTIGPTGPIHDWPTLSPCPTACAACRAAPPRYVFWNHWMCWDCWERCQDNFFSSLRQRGAPRP